MSDTLKNDDTFLAELDRRASDDQIMRENAAKGEQWDARVDQSNTAWIKKRILSKGWPQISTYGQEAVTKVWLLVQHADHDPDFQEHCLALMKKLPKTEVTLSDMAYLEDRVRVNTGRKQLYGTQFYTVNGVFGPQPIEDEANVDKRRKAAGLDSFAAYSAQMQELFEERGQ